MRLFGPTRHDLELRDHLDRLEKRLATLEAEQHPARLAEWHELAEKLKRYLSRISAVEQRMSDRQEGTTTADPKLSAVLRAKFPRQNGG